ncbi:MAG: acyl-CoA dehydrogenase family protein [Polyangiales bacterium]
MSNAVDLFSSLAADPRAFTQRLSRAAETAEEQSSLESIVGGVRDFCKAHVDAAAIDARGSLPPALLGAASEHGLFGLTVPTDHGGSGLSLKATARVVSELAAHDGSLAACVGLHSGLAMHALLHHASPAIQARYLPEVATGRRLLSFAATEPEAGSDISAVRTTLSQPGRTFSLRGSKCYVTNGGLCGLVTVLAKSPGLGGARAGHTLALIDPSWAGVGRGREEHKLGLRGSSTLTIDFDDVEVPADHTLGTIGHGLQYAHDALAWGRTLMAAGCLGTTRAALDQARAHVEARRQFGRSLAAFPRVRAVLANAEADLFVAESVVRLVGDLHAIDPRAIGVASAIAKIIASEVGWSSVDHALQLMGGAGYLEDHGVARRLRDVRVTRIFEGSNDVLRLHLATSILGASKGGASSALAPGVDEEHRALAERVDRSNAALLLLLGDVRARLGARLFSAQRLQAQLADAIMAAFGACAVLLRGPAGTSARDRSIAALASYRCERRLERAMSAASADVGPTQPWIDAIAEA